MILGGPTLAVAPCLIIGIDWESFEYNTAFTNSEYHNSFMVGVGQVSDLEVAAPLMSMTLVVLLTCGSDRAESDQRIPVSPLMWPRLLVHR